MTDDTTRSQSETPPSPFVKHVKDALEHLYDLPYLQQHALAQQESFSGGGLAELAGQRLRRELIDGVEALSPGEDVPFRAPHARLHNLLVLHYIERETVQEAAYRLGISSRQALRNLRQAEQSVAAVLWARGLTPPQEPSAAQLSSFQAEMARLGTRARPVDICSLLERASSAVLPLAAQRTVTFHTEWTEHPLTLPTDRLMAEQVLVSALSQAVGHAQPGTLHLRLAAEEEQASLTLRYPPEAETAALSALNPAAAELAQRLGWTVTQEDHPSGQRTVILQMTARCPTVLIIDDNEGLVNLLKRYLTDQACRVIAAASGQEGLRVAQEVTPDAVVLDVMMPEIPGWEVLQRLQSDPATCDIPVIICSVIIEPELAQALGASIFLPKPVKRSDVLSALHQLDVI